MPVVPRDTQITVLLRQPSQFVRKYWWALGILLIGAAADAVTTYLSLAQWGVECEMHIVQRWASQIFGLAVGVPLAKLGQVLFVLLVAAWWRRWTAPLMVLCDALYALAALNNHWMWL